MAILMSRSFTTHIDGHDTDWRYVVERNENGALIMSVNWSKALIVHGHRYLAGEGSSKHYGEYEVRANLNTSLIDYLDDAIEQDAA